MLIPEAAICRANSLPIPDEAPVTSAHGPNRFLSIWVFMCVFSSCDSMSDPPQWPHHRPQAAPRLPLRFPVPPRLRLQPFPQGYSFSSPQTRYATSLLTNRPPNLQAASFPSPPAPDHQTREPGPILLAMKKKAG